MSATSAKEHPFAIVTGASSGLGRCIAIELARRGWSTLLIARRSDLLESLAAQLAASAPSHTLPLDVADNAAIGPALSAKLRELGLHPRALINAAGYGVYVPFMEQSAAEHERLMRVNHFAPVETIRAVLPLMLEQRRGHVINIASMSTKMGPWGHAGYAASKCALVSLTQTLAAEHPARTSGVHFSYVNPGIVRTPYFETDTFQRLWPRVQKRAISPELVATRTVNLLARPRLEICVPLHYRFIELICAVSPALAQRIVAAESRPAD